MASSASNDESFSMKIAIRSIKAKFLTVTNVSTETLHSWTAQVQSDIQSDGNSASANIVQEKEESMAADGRRLLILDTRAEEEFNVSHLPGAVRADPDAKKSDVHNTVLSLSKCQDEQTVVCYCSLGYRSSQYAAALCKQLEKQTDYPNLRKSVSVYNLEGSLFKWANEKKPMVDHKNNPTKYAHPFNFLFGKVLSRDLRKSHADT